MFKNHFSFRCSCLLIFIAKSCSVYVAAKQNIASAKWSNKLLCRWLLGAIKVINQHCFLILVQQNVASCK